MSSSIFNVLILGGYGNFGARIARSLARERRFRLIIAGRNPDKARDFCEELRRLGPTVDVDAQRLDQMDARLDHGIAASGASLVIHTSGPYQGQDYRVARACISAGVNYIDLADGRDFVAGIRTLDAAARDRNVLVVSGASTLPALSSAVVDTLKSKFSRLDVIEMSIAPGQRAERGLATLQAVLTYCGKPFRAWEGGQWREVYGWQGMRTFRYPGLGWRALLRCDVPDLALFPDHYRPTRTVRFDAALELFVAQLGFWCLSWLSRAGVIKSPERLAPAFFQIGQVMDLFGSDVGGMHVRLAGLDQTGKALTATWFLTARSGCGPEIPSIPAVILAKKLASQNPGLHGAQPCLSMFTLDEFNAAVRHLPIESQVLEQHG